MLQASIALVDKTKRINHSHLMAVAAAINTQVNRDLAAHWPVSGTVTTLMDGDPIPPHVWPVYIVDQLGDGEGGYHWMDGRNQPYAEVLNTAGWTVATSHEVCEMLVDPYGNRLQSAAQIVLNDGKQSLGMSDESYLVEVCDPCEAHGYLINGVSVSDFVTPEYYQSGAGGRYDYMGRIKSPLQILPGGYISWMDPQTNDMMQITWLDDGPPQLANLGPATGKASLKDHVDSKTGSLKKLFGTEPGAGA